MKKIVLFLCCSLCIVACANPNLSSLAVTKDEYVYRAFLLKKYPYLHTIHSELGKKGYGSAFFGMNDKNNFIIINSDSSYGKVTIGSEIVNVNNFIIEDLREKVNLSLTKGFPHEGSVVVAKKIILPDSLEGNVKIHAKDGSLLVNSSIIKIRDSYLKMVLELKGDGDATPPYPNTSPK